MGSQACTCDSPGCQLMLTSCSRLLQTSWVTRILQPCEHLGWLGSLFSRWRTFLIKDVLRTPMKIELICLILSWFGDVWLEFTEKSHIRNDCGNTFLSFKISVNILHRSGPALARSEASQTCCAVGWSPCGWQQKATVIVNWEEGGFCGGNPIGMASIYWWTKTQSQ